MCSVFPYSPATGVIGHGVLHFLSSSLQGMEAACALQLPPEHDSLWRVPSAVLRRHGSKCALLGDSLYPQSPDFPSIYFRLLVAIP